LGGSKFTEKRDLVYLGPGPGKVVSKLLSVRQLVAPLAWSMSNRPLLGPLPADYRSRRFSTLLIRSVLPWEHAAMDAAIANIRVSGFIADWDTRDTARCTRPRFIDRRQYDSRSPRQYDNGELQSAEPFPQ
jgi:hypothetical protein